MNLESVLSRIPEMASHAEVERYEAERDQQQRAEWLRTSGVLPVLTADMADSVVRGRLESTPPWETVRRWVAYQRGTDRSLGHCPVLAMIGAMGRGKTVAAAWLLASEGGRYVEAEELCRLQAARWGEDREAYRRLLRAGVLVVDEVGTEEDRTRAAAALHDVVNQRQGRALTLLLGNVSRDALRERMDPRTWDRLRACAVVVELEGESMRRGDV